MDDLDRFYEQAKKLDYNAWNFRCASKKRLAKVDEGKWTPKQWLQAEKQASRRFVLRIVKMVESFE